MVPNGAGWGKEIRLCPPARKGWKGRGKDQQHPSGQMAANPQSPSWQLAPVRHGTQGFPDPPRPPLSLGARVPQDTGDASCVCWDEGEAVGVLGGARGWHDVGQDLTLPA